MATHDKVKPDHSIEITFDGERLNESDHLAIQPIYSIEFTAIPSKEYEAMKARMLEMKDLILDMVILMNSYSSKNMTGAEHIWHDRAKQFIEGV